MAFFDAMMHIDSMRLVYLDTAVLYTIADGVAEEDNVARLHDAMQSVNAALVLSMAHVWDAFHKADDETRKRLGRALDGFGDLGFVMDDPRSGEDSALRVALDLDTVIEASNPWNLRLRRINSAVLEVIESPAVIQVAETLVSIGEKVTDADTMGWEAARAVAESQYPRLRVTPDLIEGPLDAMIDAKDFQEFKELVRRCLPHRSQDVLDACLSPLESQFAMIQRQTKAFAADARKSGKSLAEYLSALCRHPGAPTAGSESVLVRGGFPRWCEIAVQVAPARYLSVILAGSNRKNVVRAPLRSDLADAIHVSMIPYVDLSTIDANNYAALRGHLARVKFRRSGRVIPNPSRDLSPLINEIVQLQ